MKKSENPLSTQEKAALDRMLGQPEPPPHLFTKITEVMKNEGHLRSPKPLLNLTPGGVLTALAFAAGLICLGFFVGKTQPAEQQQVAASGKAKFVLLVHNDDTPAEDPMQQVKEYGDWLAGISAERFANGEHLHPNGWVLTKNGSESKTEFPGRNEVGGYFLFEADSDEEAVKIAQTCPHLKYNGTLELRQIYQ
jgi:hypothetical protein